MLRSSNFRDVSHASLCVITFTQIGPASFAINAGKSSKNSNRAFVPDTWFQESYKRGLVDCESIKRDKNDNKVGHINLPYKESVQVQDLDLFGVI